MDYSALPSLRTRRTWLTPFAVADAPAVFAYARNPRVSQHTSWTTHHSVDDAISYIQRVQAFEFGYCWAIRLSPLGDAIGAVEFDLDDPASGSVHYVLAEDLWNQGLMTEVVAGVVTWAFSVFESVEQISSVAASGNVGSRRVLEKCRFEFDGLTRENWVKSVEPVEVARYTLTRARWHAAR